MTERSNSQAIIEEAAQNLRMLTMVGCGGAMLGFMVDLSLEAAGRPKMSPEMRRYLAGPIVCHSQTRKLPDGHPVKTFKPEILNERVEIALGLSPFTVGPSEICAVMFEKMLDTYAEPEFAAVYIWAACTALAKVSKAARHSSGRDRDSVYAMLRIEGSKRTDLTDDQVLTEEPYASIYRHIAGEIRSEVAKEADLATPKPAQQMPGLALG